MDDFACARQDLAQLQQVAETMRRGVESAVANLRDHLNRIEADGQRAVTTVERKRAAKGASITADPMSVFLARVEAGDATAVALKDILDRVGLKVADGKVDGGVRCFTTLEAIHLRNAGLVERTLRVIVDAWEGALASLRADFVAGVAAFLSDAPEVDDKELSRRLRDVSAKDVLDATQGDRRKNLPAYLADIYTR